MKDNLSVLLKRTVIKNSPETKITKKSKIKKYNL